MRCVFGAIERERGDAVTRFDLEKIESHSPSSSHSAHIGSARAPPLRRHRPVARASGCSRSSPPSAPVPSASAAATAATFVPLPVPQRLLDNRTSGPVASGTTVSVNVTGSAPLPATGTATAVVLNVTVLGPAGAGYWTVWPHDAPMPNASNLNIDEQASLQGAALAVANLVTVPVGPSGIVDVFSEQGGFLLVDMLGYYTPAATATAGRFQALAAPQRVARHPNRRPHRRSPARPPSIRIPGAAGASAVVLNVTTIALGGGYWTVFPAGVPAPNASNLNSTGLGHVVANQVVVPVDADGDLPGVLERRRTSDRRPGRARSRGRARRPPPTGCSSPSMARPGSSTPGWPALNPLGGAQKALPGWNLEVPVTGNPAVDRSDVAAVVLNLTTLDGPAAGYTQRDPGGCQRSRRCGHVPPRRSTWSGGSGAGQPRDGARVSARGFDVFAEQGGHLHRRRRRVLPGQRSRRRRSARRRTPTRPRRAAWGSPAGGRPDHQGFQQAGGRGAPAAVARPRVLAQRRRRQLRRHHHPGGHGVPVLERPDPTGSHRRRDRDRASTPRCAGPLRA